ncbi:hypothetical protein [Coleofasciculus sp.]|uniref:hypothetical protein n=1 Tax=Coleofasciculus sp. TaxID=3100458 RepID=UPI0039F79ABF
MAKRHRALTPKQIEQRLQQGRGIGWGKDYLPWLTVQDVPSRLRRYTHPRHKN